MLTPKKGAETVVYLASSPEVAGVSDTYFAFKKAIRSNPLSYDPAVQERLWRVSEELSGLFWLQVRDTRPSGWSGTPCPA